MSHVLYIVLWLDTDWIWLYIYMCMVRPMCLTEIIKYIQDGFVLSRIVRVFFIHFHWLMCGPYKTEKNRILWFALRGRFVCFFSKNMDLIRKAWQIAWKSLTKLKKSSAHQLFQMKVEEKRKSICLLIELYLYHIVDALRLSMTFCAIAIPHGDRNSCSFHSFYVRISKTCNFQQLFGLRVICMLWCRRQVCINSLPM